jgi:iron-sulfur cluster repair protein YtfE (RIC family)
MKGDFAILLLSTSAAYRRMVLLEARAPTWIQGEPQQTLDAQRRPEGVGRKASANREKVIFMARTISSQSLDTRTALPSSVAYLRETYPQASWQQHENFGDLASSWLHIHEALRSEGAQLRQMAEEFRGGKRTAADFRRTFPPRMTQFLQHLNGHHQVEDHFYFPKFRALDQNMVAGFDLLERDHKTIHDALVRSATSAKTFLESIGQRADASRHAADSYSADFDLLVSLLLRHLEDEEDLIVPALLHYGERSVS